MDDIARVDTSWKLQGSDAELRSAGLCGAVNVSQPALGLHDLVLGGQRLDANILCVGSDDVEAAPAGAGAWPLADAYVRGNDLVATYQPRDSWPFSPQVYWQVNPLQATTEAVGSLTLFISVQTHLLDTWPRIHVHSKLAADESLWVRPDGDAGPHATPISGRKQTIQSSASAVCVLQRLAGGRVSYAEMMPASDFREVSVQADAHGLRGTRWELFADFLEKGVIWRARLQSVLLPRENDVELAAAWCRALEQRPLPLTT